jgi:site-specific DNA recombinase
MTSPDDSENCYYIRSSLDRDRNKVSTAYQREALLKLCAEKGWADPVEYCDRNVSATKGRRERYEDMCADIASGKRKRMAVWDMDRLHRQPRELEDFIDLAEVHHIDLANVGGDVDLSTPGGRFFARMKGTVAKYEIEQKVIRQKAANEQRAKGGKPWVSRPFGYTFKIDRDAAAQRAEDRARGLALEAEKPLEEAVAEGEAAYAARAAAWNPVTDSTDNEIVEHEADAIRKGCTALLDGGTLYGIAKEWNSKGLKTSTGCTWTGGQVRQVLTRARNAGLQTYNAEVLYDVEVKWPAIVDVETYEAVTALLADPKRHTGKTPGRKHLLTGIAICGVCNKTLGTTMRRLKSGGNRPVYACKRIGCLGIVRGLAQVDERVIDTIAATLADPAWAVTLNGPSVDLGPLKARKADLRKLIARTREEYEEGEIDAKDRNARIARCEEKIAKLDDELIPAHVPTDVRALAGKPDARERFEALPLDRRRGVISWMAVVTIQPQRTGGRFDPTAITVVGRKAAASDEV